MSRIWQHESCLISTILRAHIPAGTQDQSYDYRYEFSETRLVMLLNHSITVSHFVLVNNFVLVNRKGDSKSKWSGKEWLGKIGPEKMPIHIIPKKLLCSKKCVIQQCFIIIPKVSHDSSHLSLWPKKVLEEFLNPRTSFPTESLQFPHVWTFIIGIFRKVLEEFFKAENEFPASSSPPMGLSSPPLGLGSSPPMGLQPSPPAPPHTQQSIHTGES